MQDQKNCWRPVEAYHEEQEMELEALSALLTCDEFCVEGKGQFRLKIIPYHDVPQQNRSTVCLRFSFPLNYPDVSPIYTFLECDGINEKLMNKMQKILDETIKRRLGHPMIYDIVEALQDYLRSNEDTQVHSEILNLGEDKIVSGVTGTAVDLNFNSEFPKLRDKDLCLPENRVTDVEFKEWANKFKAEMEELGLWKLNKQNEHSLTGKQIFQTLEDNSFLKSNTTFGNL